MASAHDDTRPASPAAGWHELNRLLLGQMLARSIGLAAELGIADLLGNGTATAAELAARTGSNEDALYRVLRALASAGVFEERPGRRFANNGTSHHLRQDAEGSLGAMARWLVDGAGWAAWGRLDHSVRTGAPAFDAVAGKGCFEWLSEHPASLQVFQRAMATYGTLTAAAVADAYDFADVGTLLDVGGGQGGLLAVLARRFPSLSGVLFDRPEVVARAGQELEALVRGGRLRLVGGDFFESVPAGADAIVLEHVLHDWDDAACLRLLGSCRRGLAAGGRLLVIESLVSDAPDGAFAKLLDLEMLVVTGGRERELAEHRRLLGESGFRPTRVVPTSAGVSIIEAHVH